MDRIDADHHCKPREVLLAISFPQPSEAQLCRFWACVDITAQINQSLHTEASAQNKAAVPKKKNEHLWLKQSKSSQKLETEGGVHHTPALSSACEQRQISHLLCNAVISNCTADANIKPDYCQVNKAEHHIHSQHFLCFQGNYFQRGFGS